MAPTMAASVSRGPSRSPHPPPTRPTCSSTCTRSGAARARRPVSPSRRRLPTTPPPRRSPRSPTGPTRYGSGRATGSAPAARWTMDEASGPALDATPHGNTAALTGGVSRGAGRAGVGSTLTFDGSTGYAATTGAVNTIDAVTSAPKTVRTDANFTVTAWVYLTANNRWLTAAAEEGSRSSAFYLQFNPVDNRWCFSRTWADTDNTGATRALSAGAPALNTWTHLAGVYDASTSQLRLYVNGVLESAVSYTSAWNATGPVTIGRAKWNGAMVDFWAGSVDEVQIYDRVLAPGEIQAMAVPLPPVLTFPYGTTPEAGQQVTMTVDA